MKAATFLALATCALLAACGGGDAEAPATPCTAADAGAELATARPLQAGMAPVLQVALADGGQAVHVAGVLKLAHAGVGIDRVVTVRVARDDGTTATLGDVAVPVGARLDVAYTYTDTAPPHGPVRYALDVVDTRNGSTAWAMPGSTLAAQARGCAA